jgi:methylisocitrate lyase
MPLLANMTEFGATALWPRKTLAEADISMALYPLSAQRAAAL